MVVTKVWWIVIAVLIGLIAVNGDATCERYCDREYTACVNRIALAIPEDQYAYYPCQQDWEKCDDRCQAAD